MAAHGAKVKTSPRVSLRAPWGPFLQLANRLLRVTVIIFLSRNIFMQITIITAETVDDND